ncbi:hypothetical protein [Rubrivirga sp.]|uniref:hypothetical protein n=1 Tax=Rubrivirga sp. TaxID=1885344 RepID=UPI003B52A5CA
MLRAVLFVALISPLAAQDLHEVPLLLDTGLHASVADSSESLDARRWRTVRTFVGAVGGYVTLGLVGGAVGFQLDSSGCGDVCLPDGMWVGWALGSTVGAGLGAHVGSGRSGSMVWALVGAGAAQGALGLYAAATDNPVPILIPVSILAATIADRVAASR